MKYFFSEIDEITLTFSDIEINHDGMEYIRIYFERPNERGFDFLESTLPALNVKACEGFSQKEVGELLDYARTNAFLIWEIAREDSDKVAANFQITRLSDFLLVERKQRADSCSRVQGQSVSRRDQNLA